MNDKLEIGQIVNTRGLKGEVKVNSFSEASDRFETINTILIKFKSEYKEYKIEKVSYSKNQVILKLKGVDTIDDAEKLRNSYIYIYRNQLGELPEGTYYIADLIGLDVCLENGEKIGIVDDIFSTGSNDVYVVKDELGKQKLLPAIDEVLKEIDIANGRIIVNLIEGL